MSVRFWTGNARGLLYAFEQAIYDREIVTWIQDADRDFTHVSDQLKGKAFLRPKIFSDALAFGIIKPEDTDITDYVFGMYQASLIQSFLSHLSGRFTLADASSGFRDRDGDLSKFTISQPNLSRIPHRAEFVQLAREIRSARA